MSKLLKTPTFMLCVYIILYICLLEKFRVSAFKGRINVFSV